MFKLSYPSSDRPRSPVAGRPVLETWARRGLPGKLARQRAVDRVDNSNVCRPVADARAGDSKPSRSRLAAVTGNALCPDGILSSFWLDFAPELCIDSRRSDRPHTLGDE